MIIASFGVMSSVKRPGAAMVHPASSLPGVQKPPKVHLDYLDGMRALAALYVVCFHTLVEVDPSGTLLKGKVKALASLFTLGHQSVDVFIVLSGFCLMLPVARSGGELLSGSLTFFKKRAVRILPPYYFCLAVSLILIALFLHTKTGHGWDAAIPITREGVLLHLLLLQDCLPSTASQINYSLWSISVEWRIYFVFPLMVLLWRRVGGLLTTALFTGVSIVLMAVLPHTPLYADPEAITGVMPQYLALFAFGALGAGVAYSDLPGMTPLRGFRGWQWVALGGALVTVALVKAKWHHYHLPLTVSDLVAGGAATSLLVYVAIAHQSPVGKVLAWRPLVFLGSFAYSIYLIHALMIELTFQFLVQPLHLGAVKMLIAQALLGIPLTLVGGYLFFLAFERPFLTKRKRETPAEVARDAARSPAP